MFLFQSLFIILLLRTSVTQYCDYNVDKFQEIICLNITTLEEIRDRINATVIRDKSLLKLIEIVRLGQCELPQFSVQQMSYLPQLKEIEIFNSTITKLSYEEDTDLLPTIANLDDTTNSNKGDGLPVRTIILANNNIKIVDSKSLKGLGDLLKLDLQNNEITTITAETLSGSTVQELLLVNNYVTNIEIDNSSNLVNITLTFNNITRVNVTSFTGSRIQRLDLSYNEIQFIEPKSFTSSQNFYELNLRENNITKIENTTFYGVLANRLFLGANPIRHLGYNSFAEGRFELLSFEGNQLTEIYKEAFSACSVQRLDISFGQIEIIERNAFNNVSSLQYLDLSYNSIDSINASTFTIPSLEILDLGYNHIVFVEPGAFTGASSLRELSLLHNQLSTVKKNMYSGSAMQRLSLGHNQIVTVEPFAFIGLSNLTSLDLEGNKILYIDEEVLPGKAVQELYIGYNPDVSIRQGIFEKINDLHVLDLRGSNMSSIPPFPISVRKLNFDYNNVTSIKASAFPFLGSALELVFLGSNKISTIEPFAFSNLRTLRELYIRDNQLSEIGKYSFGQSTVKELYLTWNYIRLIELGAFSGLNLILLDLRSNEVTKIEKNTFSGSSIKELDLAMNKIEIIEPYAFSAVKDLYEHFKNAGC